MLTINEYRKVESLEEAYELNQKKNNKIIAGGVWMKIGDRRISTAIDLSGLGLDKITETETEFVIGAMTSLREIEKHVGLAAPTERFVRVSAILSAYSSATVQRLEAVFSGVSAFLMC